MSYCFGYDSLWTLAGLVHAHGGGCLFSPCLWLLVLRLLACSLPTSSTTSGEGAVLVMKYPPWGQPDIKNRPYSLPHLQWGLGCCHSSPCCTCILGRDPGSTLRICHSGGYASQENLARWRLGKVNSCNFRRRRSPLSPACGNSDGCDRMIAALTFWLWDGWQRRWSSRFGLQWQWVTNYVIFVTLFVRIGYSFFI
jgi:hypothetical protein